MDTFKLTAWNIEHSDKLLDDLGSASRKRHAEARLDAITAEIAALDADILLIGEGPPGPVRAMDFFGRTAPGYRLVTRPDPAPDAYGMKGGSGPMGRQWLWFLIRDGRPITGELLHLDRWQAMTEAQSRGEHQRGKWQVSFPKWQAGGGLEFSIPETHDHWRHPQVLLAQVDGMAVDIIGCLL